MEAPPSTVEGHHRATYRRSRIGLWAPRLRETIEEFTDEPGSIAANRTGKMLFLTWHDSRETTKKPFSTASQVIDDAMRKLSFENTELDGEAGFTDVVGSGVDSSGLSHDESFGVDDMDLNLNEPIVGRTQEPIVVAEVNTQVSNVEDVGTQVPIVEEFGTQEFSVEDVELKIIMDLPFDNIGVTNLVSGDVLEGEDVDVINADDFDSDLSNVDSTTITRRGCSRIEERNRSVRIRARCDGKVPIFTMSQGTGPSGPNRGMQARPSGSSGLTTRSKKKKNTCPNDDSQAFSSILDAHYKGDLCPWVLEIKHCTYKLLSEKIFDQVRVNPDIPVMAVQDQLQRDLEYSMLRDYVVELQSTNPNTTVKIVVERNTDPFLPTKVFQSIYVCLGALKLGFRDYGRDLLGLDGDFMKGPFPGQVLSDVGLDSNNGIYPLAYALVEAESNSSWCWFLQCLGDDIHLHPNSNFTFISDIQKVKRRVPLHLSSSAGDSNGTYHRDEKEAYVEKFIVEE
ncbi:FAR1-related sequence 5-like protein isoform X2 [Tanacetum coccineum]